MTASPGGAPQGHRVTPAARLGLGLAALGRPGYINLGHGADLGADRSVSALEANAHAVLDAAWAAGVRHVDAARSYGRAEAFLAAWLQRRGLAPGDLVVSSKWGYTYTARWRVDAEQHEVKEHTLAVLERQWGESRALLGAHLGLYQVHSLTLDSPLLRDPPLLRALAQRKGSGVRLGFSASGPAQAQLIRRALALEVDGVRLFDSVQATWNLLEPSAGEALREAHASGVQVIVKEALANGRLAGREAGNAATLLHDIAQAHACGSDAVALAATLAQPWVDVVLSGAATTAQLHANLRAGGVALREDERRALAALAEPPEAYWQRRGALAWN